MARSLTRWLRVFKTLTRWSFHWVGLCIFSASPAPSTPANDTIGNEDDSAGAGAPGAAASDVVPGPLGSASSTNQGASAEAPTSGASAFPVSAIAGVAAVAGYFF
ncbi:hypothetical protein GH714_024807 [Hevea brasiliensis]|uniref:Uncharacterized protein n=1 Tax=Hevea brasiliensis TaxID=3981 RepID=A0A6A6M2Q8_HEVBR|nr:hypothetical protein GH714_024807 [Hevea brasiliensis]